MKKTTLILLTLLSLCAATQAQSAMGKLIVVGNKTGTTTATLSEIRKIFKAKYSTWSNGEAITIVLPSPKTANAEPAARTIYQTTVPSMQKFWLSLVFQGRASPPVFTDSDVETLQYIQKTPGAIGVVDVNTPGIPRTMIIQVTP